MELFSDQPGDEGLPGHKRMLAMAAAMTTTTMAVFDGSMVNIALPQIAGALHVASDAVIWVANGYLLTAAMTLAIFAALVARIGFKAQFTIGLTLFTLTSLGCILSTSLDTLVVMRLLQGIGGAATLSIVPALLRSIFPNRVLGRILGLNALLIGACTAVAPVLAGTLLSAMSWKWLFAINIPLGLIALALTLAVIPGKEVYTREPFDLAGAIFSAMALGALVMATDSFARLTDHSEPATRALITAIAYGLTAVISGMAFIWRQRRAPQPLLPLHIFMSTRFSLAALTSLISFIAQGIAFVALPFLFQSIYGYSAFYSALLFTPWPIGILLLAPHAGRLADRHPPAIISTAGLCLFTIGLALLALLPNNAQMWDICIRSLICGMGFGCFQSPNNREMLANVSRENSGYASGVLAIMRTFGQCLGAAIVAVALSMYVQPGNGLHNTGQETLAIQSSLWLAVIAATAAIITSVKRMGNVRNQRQQQR